MSQQLRIADPHLVGAILTLVLALGSLSPAACGELATVKLRNPVWTSKDNLRDPSVLKVAPDGYLVFYSRLASTTNGWGDPRSWAIACAATKDFIHFENDHDVSPKGHASPGDVVKWHGRWLLPYQSYPAKPTRLVFSESADLKSWTTPRPFLTEAFHLPWNEQERVIDPSFVVDGDTLHCWFVGSGYRTNTTGQRIRGNLMGHAVTRDPALQQWVIVTTNAPLIGFSETAPDGVENTMVFRTSDHWTMIYSEGLAAQHLALASSKDLINWKLEGKLDLPTQQWMCRKFGAPFVWQEGSQWLMMLMGENAAGRTTFGLLDSTDGKRWRLLPEQR